MTDELFSIIRSLHHDHVPYALATVVAVEGSASAKVGSKAIISHDGRRLAGWVGGGCADSQCRSEAVEAIEHQTGRLVFVNMNDEVLGTGMPCGGSMQIFIDPIIPAPSLWLLGHGRIAESLCAMAKEMGMRVVVNDLLAQLEQFPEADVIVNDDIEYNQLSPSANDFVVIATQHKGDHDSLRKVLTSEVGYVGLIASKKRARLIIDFLKEQAFSDAQIARVRTPCGLQLGAQTPEEIALSVLSEIVMVRRQGSGKTMSVVGVP